MEAQPNEPAPLPDEAKVIFGLFEHDTFIDGLTLGVGTDEPQEEKLN